jgi:hypothetical protein
MGWTGGILCEALMKTAYQTFKKTTFLTVLTLILLTGWSMGWMGGGCVVLWLEWPEWAHAVGARMEFWLPCGWCLLVGGGGGRWFDHESVRFSKMLSSSVFS